MEFGDGVLREVMKVKWGHIDGPQVTVLIGRCSWDLDTYKTKTVDEVLNNNMLKQAFKNHFTMDMLPE